MSEPARRRGSREHWASDHERARHLAAQRLGLPLPSAEDAWLQRHLRTCLTCAAIADEYAAQQAALRSLDEPHPPRDLWARTAAALDRAERQARDVPGPSVFPGRRGIPGSRGSRSIRGLRAEQRASAFRTSTHPVPGRLAVTGRDRPGRRGLGWVAPFGALAALAMVIVVGGGTLLTQGVSPLTVSGNGTPSGTTAAAVAPAATPIRVGAGEVAWLTPGDDGTYSLNMADVDQVCPNAAAPDCAPIAAASPRHLPSVKTTLHSVLRDPSHRNLVVVTMGSKKSSGGTLYVVAVPTEAPASPTPGHSASPAASTSQSSAAASTAASPAAPSATPPPTATPGASDGTSPSDPVPASPQPSGAADSPAPSDAASVPPAATPSDATPATTAAATEPAVTATTDPAHSPAAPSASSSPSASAPAVAPQPTATALAIISNVVVVGETAAYSPDGTMLAFSARPADGSAGPDIYLWRVGDAVAHPVTTDHASIFSGWLNNQLLGSRAVDAAGHPAESPTPDTSGGTAPASGESPAASESATPLDTASPSAPEASASPSPSVAPSPSASAPEPSPSPVGANGATVAGLAVGGAAVSLVSVVRGAVADVPGAASARSFILDPLSGGETPLVGQAWRPVVDPTGRFVVYWAGSLRYDAAALTWLPDHGALVLASWPALRGADPASSLDPVPLLGNGPGDVPGGEWDIRWDETGAHVGVWLADADNPDLGRLSLLSVDPSGRIDANGISLHDAPALAGFSIGDGRLAWATPPGQDGEGSRLQVLAWIGENAGKIDSQPVSGGDAVVVVR